MAWWILALVPHILVTPAPCMFASYGQQLPLPKVQKPGVFVLELGRGICTLLSWYRHYLQGKKKKKQILKNCKAGDQAVLDAVVSNMVLHNFGQDMPCKKKIPNPMSFVLLSQDSLPNYSQAYRATYLGPEISEHFCCICTSPLACEPTFPKERQEKQTSLRKSMSCWRAQRRQNPESLHRG